MLLALLNLKGGSGKSTLAINIAAAACLEGLRVLLIDLDCQDTVDDWGAARPATSPLMGISVVKLDKPATIERARIAPVIRGYDVVVLDAPARDVPICEAAAIAADVVLIPVKPGAPDVWTMNTTAKAIDAADTWRKRNKLRAVVRLHAINQAVSGSRLERAAQTHLLTTIGDYAGVVHQRLVFGEATALGESVLTMKPPAHDAAHDIRQLWRTIEESHAKTATNARKASAIAAAS